MRKLAPELGQDVGYRGSLVAGASVADSAITSSLLFGLLLAVAGGCDLTSTDGPSTGPGLEPPGIGESSGDGFGNAMGGAPVTGPGGMDMSGTGGAPSSTPTSPTGMQAGGNGGASAPPDGSAGSGAPVVITPESCPDATRIAVEQEPGVMSAWEQMPTLTCRYEMPPEAIAYMPERVALAYTDAGVVTVVPHVADESACDPMTGGWYYDLTMSVPRIVVCPQSCEGEGAELLLDCPQATAP